MQTEWRLTWTMWPKRMAMASDVEKIHTDEHAAREQLRGLESMLAPGPTPEPCDNHVWRPRLWTRTRDIDPPWLPDHYPDAAGGPYRPIRLHPVQDPPAGH